MAEFHETGYGKRFYESQLPELIKQLGRIADGIHAEPDVATADVAPSSRPMTAADAIDRDYPHARELGMQMIRDWQTDPTGDPDRIEPLISMLETLLDGPRWGKQIRLAAVETDDIHPTTLAASSDIAELNEVDHAALDALFFTIVERMLAIDSEPSDTLRTRFPRFSNVERTALQMIVTLAKKGAGLV